MHKMKYCSTQTGYSAQVGDGVIAQELDGGAPRYRRAVRGTYHSASVEWVVREVGFQYLMAFYRVWTRNPSQPFLAQLCIDNAPVENYQCHFDGAPSINSKQADVFTVSASLRVKPLTVNSEMDDLIVGTVDYGEDLASLVNPLEELVNEDLPNALGDFTP